MRKPIQVARSEGEFDAAAGFLAAGVERDEVCVLLGHAVANSRVLAGLERRGLTPDELERRDRLHTVSTMGTSKPCRPAGSLPASEKIPSP
jgi:hypothetical protein